jgi:prepilin-type N-terminal cleavage/methylation domain-containing protein
MFSFVKKLKKGFDDGFTLVEMLVSISIFMILTAVVLFNHGAFNSSMVVTNLSYEVALAIRQAQTYGLAVKQEVGDVSSFENAYGVFFDVNDAKSFYIFADKDGDQWFDPSLDSCDGTDECVEKIEIRGDVSIESLKSFGSDNEDNDLAIIFKRPNPVAIIWDENERFPGNSKAAAEIVLYSQKADKRKVVRVESSGQISVKDYVN